MKKLLYIIGTMAILLALSCSKGEEETPPADPIPLSVGNWWLFQDLTNTTKWSKDSIVVQESFGSHADAYRVIETGSDKGIRPLLRLPYSDSIWFFYDGDYFTVGLIMPPPIDTMEIKYFKKNPSVGDSWFTRMIWITDMEPDGTDDTLIRRFNGKIVGQQDVTVPAGTFTGAYRAFYTSIDSTWISSNGSWEVNQDTICWIYWALGTGPVKLTDPPDESTGSQLKDYDVK